MIAFYSVRARLTIWYTAVLALVLITFSGISYILLDRASRATTDRSLADSAQSAAAELHDGPVEREEIARELANFGSPDSVVIALDPHGNVLASSRTNITKPEQSRIVQFLRSGRAGYASLPGGHEDDGLRIYALPVLANSTRYTVGVARDLDDERDRLENAAQALLLGIPLALILAAAGGYLLARKSLAPVTSMSMKAREIGAETLAERITVANERDELGFLATTLNDLLERLQRAFDSQRGFMADASHELRTPISIIQGEADVSLSRAHRSEEEYRGSISIIQAAARKLTRVVESLFLLARSDAGAYPISPEPFYLDELADECVRTLRSVAAARRVELTCHASADLLIVADQALIHRMVLNVVENALKFTPAGGFVHVEASRAGDEYIIRVTDSGSGIAEDERELVFERFYRGKSLRSGSPGAGLGLPIGRWIAQIHHGKLLIERSDATGTTFAIVLPSHESQNSCAADEGLRRGIC